MAEPILAIDFGTTTTSAILIVGSGEEFVEEPSSHGRCWPSSVCLDSDNLLVGTPAEARKRRRPQEYRAEFKRDLGERDPLRLGDRSYPPADLVTAVLAAVAREAERIAGQPVRRAVLTVPASYGDRDPRAELMIQAGIAAGFSTVELLPEPVAAALAPVAGEPFAPGALVLVYDFGGGTFDTALVRIGAAENEVLGHAALDGCGGRDIDLALARALEESAGDPLAELLDGPRPRMRLSTQAVSLKIQLTETDAAEEEFGDTDVLLVADRTTLDALVEPLLAETLDCVKDLLAVCQVAVEDLGAVLLVGGVTRMPVVAATVEHMVGVPIRHARTPELSVVQGAGVFARNTARRHIMPTAPTSTERPLRWVIPGGTATLLRWLARPGEKFDAGQSLGEARLIDGAIWELRADRPGSLTATHVSPGATVHSGDWLLTVDVVPVLLSTPVELLRLQHDARVWGLAFDPTGTRFATCGSDASVRMWDTLTRTTLWVGHHEQEAYAVTFSPDGTRLASCSDDKSVRVWDAATGAQQLRLSHEGWTFNAEFSPDGSRLATACGDNQAYVWDAASGTVVLRHKHQGAVRSVAFSADGTRVATCSDDKTARLYGVARHAEQLRLAHDSEVSGVAFSPDGTRVATAGNDGAARLWSVAYGTELLRLRHDGGRVYQALFSPDGHRLATCGQDELVRVWDAASGAELLRIPHGSQATRIAFGPAGDRLATTGLDDDFARIWRIA